MRNYKYNIDKIDENVMKWNGVEWINIFDFEKLTFLKDYEFRLKDLFEGQMLIWLFYLAFFVYFSGL